MKKPRVACIDFETFGIEGRPKYPPMPVGVSIKYPGKKSRYYAFGHPSHNNCSWNEAVEAVEAAYAFGDGVLFQNAKFDVDVAEHWFDIPVPSWRSIHDTMFLLFLDDPHQKELGLKESSERLFDLKASEQKDIGDWLVEHQPIPDIKISLSKGSDHYFGRYLAFAPGDLAGKYAEGDTDRTMKLFNLLWPKTKSREMLEPYDRERKLMPILLGMEQQGIPVDLKRLQNDVENYSYWSTVLDDWLIKKLKCLPSTNLNSGVQLFNAMLDAGLVDEDKALLTKTGKYQTNKEALLVAVKDKQLLGVLKHRSQLNTCLNTFMIPWLKTATASKGYIYTSWNQVRAPKGDSTGGARTGRLSSSPNFQNIPNEFKPIFKHDTKDGKLSKSLPKCPFKDLPALPKIRSYIVPGKGSILIDRDYSQQEPRILAHFDGGDLMDKYLEDPWLDMHRHAQLELESVGKFYDRKPVKNTNLGLIYGMGVGLLAEKNGMTVEESKTLKKAVLSLYPGLKEMQQEMKLRAVNDMPIRTWGGREYFCEPPKIVDGRMRTFDYKMVNVLVQGSASDCTKEAIIRYHAIKSPEAHIILNVHDQITVICPVRIYKKEMEKLRLAMEGIEFEVAMLTEGTISRTNWDELKDYDAKGVLV